MKKFHLVLIIAFTGTLLFALDGQAPTYNQLDPEPHYKKVTQLITHILTKNHYKKMVFSDSLSSEIYDAYLGNLDYNRVLFLKSDIDNFENFRYLLDDYLLAGHVKPAYDIFNIYQQRFAARLEYVFERMETGFNYNIDEYMQLDREAAPWPENESELRELWRKRLKYEALNLRLAGKDSAGISEILIKRYQNLERRIKQYESEDVFQLFMNSIAESFDPHTNYFSPKSFENFKIQMSQSFEGIGARLSTQNEHTVVMEIIPGGPADKSKILHPNDKITAVGQGDDGEMVDVVGWRIDDVVQLIRGKRNTTVRLQLLRAASTEDAPRDTIALVRDKVNIEDQTAKSRVIDIEHEGQQFSFGIIEIPTFYSDYDGRRSGLKDYNSTTRDVRRLIKGFDFSVIDGIIIDLRRNGGGFLNEAVDLTGLFIEKGPVVQVKNTTGRIEVEWDDDPDQIYAGPLAVLVDRISASASEIFAAAIQDYDRGIIIGSQTFGKGTVQNALDLNRFIKSPQKLGQIKLTIAKFYRINGGSTQHVGVIPDITFPSRFNYMDIGESNQPNALLWDQIRPAEYSPVGDVQEYTPRLNVLHSARLGNDEEYAQLLSDLEEYRINRERKTISLNEQVRRKEREQRKKSDESDSNSEAESESESESKDDKDLMLAAGAHALGDYIILSGHKTAKNIKK